MRNVKRLMPREKGGRQGKNPFLMSAAFSYSAAIKSIPANSSSDILFNRPSTLLDISNNTLFSKYSPDTVLTNIPVCIYPVEKHN